MPCSIVNLHGSERCSKKAVFSTARGASLAVLRLTAINLVRGALLHHPRSVAGSKLAAHVQE